MINYPRCYIDSLSLERPRKFKPFALKGHMSSNEDIPDPKKKGKKKGDVDRGDHYQCLIGALLS